MGEKIERTRMQEGKEHGPMVSSRVRRGPDKRGFGGKKESNKRSKENR